MHLFITQESKAVNINQEKSWKSNKFTSPVVLVEAFGKILSPRVYEIHSLYINIKMSFQFFPMDSLADNYPRIGSLSLLTK